MPDRKHKIELIVLLVVDILVIALSLHLAFLARQQLYINVFDVRTGAMTFTMFAYILSFYIFDVNNVREKVWSISYFSRYIVAILFATVIVVLIFYSFPPWKLGRGVALINMSFIMFLCFLSRLLLQPLHSRTFTPRRILIAGAGRAGRTIYSALLENSMYWIVGFIDSKSELVGTSVGSHPVLGTGSALVDVVEDNNVDTIVVAVTHEKSTELVRKLLECKVSGVDVYDMPILYELLTGRLPLVHIDDSWFVYTPFQGFRRSIYMNKTKRLVDIFISVAGLVAATPIFLLAALAIKLDSRGPIFFTQERVGKDGRKFKLIKFRTMRTDAESNGAVWAEENDQRVTRVGKVLRTTRVDEIPQFWNVLKGVMSFIGPRPERPEFIQMLNDEIPFYSLRHAVRPGITGWAQINYRYGASMEDSLIKLQYDLFYIKNLSPMLDLQIFLRTIRVVLSGYGSR